MKWLKKLPCEISGVNSFEVSSPQWGGDDDPGTDVITGAPSNILQSIQYTFSNILGEERKMQQSF